MRTALPIIVLLAVGCAWNPPLDRGDGRGGQPQITRDWDDAGQTGGSGFDAGAPFGGRDAGALPDAGGPSDAGPGDAGAPDAGPSTAVDCAGFAAVGYEVCGSFADACEIIFRDGSGCNSACARAGLVCEDSWNDEPGLCAPDRGEHYGCRESGHDSDYCVCVRAP